MSLNWNGFIFANCFHLKHRINSECTNISYAWSTGYVQLWVFFTVSKCSVLQLANQKSHICRSAVSNYKNICKKVIHVKQIYNNIASNLSIFFLNLKKSAEKTVHKITWKNVQNACDKKEWLKNAHAIMSSAFSMLWK